jgi:acetoin utilization protein AcuB
MEDEMNKVAQWMTSNPVTIEDNASIIEAVHLMKEKNVRRLPVTRQGRFVGLVTEQMIKEYTPSKATSLDTWEVHYLLSKTAVKEAMNPTPFVVSPDTHLTAAAQQMHDKKIYGLCVVNDNGELIGIITITNILEALIALCRKGGC